MTKNYTDIKPVFLLICLLLSFFISSNSFGQNRIDSLNTSLKTSIEDTSKVKLLNDLGYEYITLGEYGKADSVVKIAKTLSENLKYKKGTARSLSLLGGSLKNQGENKSALDFYFKALKLNEEIKDKEGIAANRGNIGVIYYLQSDYSKALENYTIALRLCEELKDKKGAGRYFGNIGMTYEDQGQYSVALEYYFRALKINEEDKDKSGIAKFSGTIGNIFYYQSDYPKALEYYKKALRIKEEQYNETGKAKDKTDICLHLGNIGNVYYSKKNYDLALEYYFKALKIGEGLENKQLMANNLGNLGNVYLAQENIPKALEFYLKTLEIARDLQNKPLITNNLSNIGSLYIRQNNYGKAEEYLQNALKIASEIGYYDAEKEIHQSLSDLYSRQKKWELSLKHYQLYVIAKDSIFNEENTRKAVRSELNFEFEKKQAIEKAEQEKINAIEAKEKQKQKIITYSVSLVLLMVAILAIFIFRSYRQKQKDNILITLQKKEVERAKAVIENQKKLVEEKHKEITDSINYAERIQRSFLATKEMLDANLNDYFVFFKPKDVVSGDFYWATKLVSSSGVENFALATSDSTGHGVPGAIMSLLNITSLEKAIEHSSNPSEILNLTRKTIIDRLKKDGSEEGGKDGMDCSLTVYDFANKKLIVASAHNPVWIVRKQSQNMNEIAALHSVAHNDETYEVIEIKADKMPVGKHDRQDVSFTQHEIQLQTGDVVYTLTDGFPDQFGGEKGKKFMSKNLRELLATNVHLSMNKQKELLETTFAKWVGELEQVDDVTIIGIRI